MPKTTAKKSTKANSSKKVAVKPPKAKAKASTNGELRKGQVSILKALKGLKNGLTTKALATKAEINSTMIGNLAGYKNPEINSREVHAGNLLNRKFVKMEVHDIKGKDVLHYVITASGAKAL